MLIANSIPFICIPRHCCHLFMESIFLQSICDILYRVKGMWRWNQFAYVYIVQFLRLFHRITVYIRIKQQTYSFQSYFIFLRLIKYLMNIDRLYGTKFNLTYTLFSNLCSLSNSCPVSGRFLHQHAHIIEMHYIQVPDSLEIKQHTYFFTVM